MLYLLVSFIYFFIDLFLFGWFVFFISGSLYYVVFAALELSM